MADKKLKPVTDPNTLDRDTIMFYKGRHPAFPGYHFYILKDTNKEVSFKKRVQPSHRIGIGYPVSITGEGHTYATTRNVPVEQQEVWGDNKEIASWIRDDEAAGRETKRLSEQAGLRTKARKLAEQIRPEYKRASSVTKRDIIAAFIETLEAE